MGTQYGFFGGGGGGREGI